MKDASLIISHAGAGSIMEGLALNKVMLVVINSSLMDNHQSELAYALSRRHHLLCVDSPQDLLLKAVWDNLSKFNPQKFKDIPWEKVMTKIDEVMGFT